MYCIRTIYTYTYDLHTVYRTLSMKKVEVLPETSKDRMEIISGVPQAAIKSPCEIWKKYYPIRLILQICYTV